MNPFEVLEISAGASPDEIKAAYHRLAKRWHPDRFTGAEKAEAENRFRMLAEAFNMLKDQTRRSELGKTLPAASQTTSAPSAAIEDQAQRPLAERTAGDWLQDAKEAFVSRDFSRALGLVQYALRLDSCLAEGHVLLAQLIEATGGDRRALIKALESAVKLNPKDVDSMIRLADVYQSNGMHARAVGVRESARQLAPNHAVFRSATPKASSAPPQDAGLVSQLSALVGRLFRKG